MVAWKNYM